MRTRTLSSPLIAGVSAVGFCALGCSREPGAGQASLSVTLEGERTITSPIEAGEGVDQIRDGWTASYERYIAVLGHVHLSLATDDSITALDPRLFAVDLRQTKTSGVALWSFEGLAEGRWNFSYELGEGSEAEADESVSDEDFARVQEEGLSYLIAGRIERAQGISCPPAALAEPGDATSSETSDAGDPCYPNPVVEFELAVGAETDFGPCEIDGVPGVALSEGQQQSATITLHGDHLFFNGFPEGGEGGVVRRAQWLADCDLNLDGRVTRQELESIAPLTLPALADAELGGSPLTPLDSMWTYVTAQLKTQGHYEGEGECAVDGVTHEHDDHEH